MVLFWAVLISSFSALPLRLSVFLGLLVAACGVGYALYSIFAATVLRATVPGWTSLVCLNIIFSGATLMAIGLVGEYVARIYEEAKGRPLYIVSGSANVTTGQSHVAKAVILSSAEDESTYEPPARKAHRV